MHVTAFYLYSIYAMAATEPLLIVLSCIFCYRQYNPKYMRSLPIYFTIQVIPDLIAYLTQHHSFVIYYSFSFFELLFFTYFISSILRLKNAKISLWTIALLGLIADISFPFFKQLHFGVEGINGYAIFIECLVFIIGCIEYIREIMIKPDIPELSREPAFWMICGILCYFLTLVPTMIFCRIAESENWGDAQSIIWSFNNYAQLISAAFFITAMLCTRKQKS